MRSTSAMKTVDDSLRMADNASLLFWYISMMLLKVCIDYVCQISPFDSILFRANVESSASDQSPVVANNSIS